jgi:hypothetical protein
MAFSTEPVRGDCLTHTICIWPSRALVAGSAYWPESWHQAFRCATRQVGRVVASYVLGGLAITPQPITMELPVGCIGFSVRCRDTSIYIAVSDFEGPDDSGPDAPGPNGATRRQGSPADGLILGLRGTGKSSTVVTFYGPLSAHSRGTSPSAGGYGPRIQHSAESCAGDVRKLSQRPGRRTEASEVRSSRPLPVPCGTVIARCDSRQEAQAACPASPGTPSADVALTERMPRTGEIACVVEPSLSRGSPP